MNTQKKDAILRDIIAPLIQLQDIVTVVKSAENFHSTKHPWVKDCLIPDYENWFVHLPDEQITWLGDDCEKLAQTIADKAFPSLSRGIARAIRALGSDNPTVLAKGIFEYAKLFVSPFETSLFAFGVIQLMRGDQFAFRT